MRIPALDGWRGISVSLVIVGHLANYRWGLESALASYASVFGVKVFFVISGFLITRLALHEEQTIGSFSALAFYRRRVYRILPAFFVFLAVVLALASLGLIAQPASGVFAAAFFTCNLPGAACGWYVGHSWSLAYEEQFYLLFPLAFLGVASAQRLRLFTVLHASIALAPLLSFALPGNWAPFRVFVVHFGCISAGVLFALHMDRLTAIRNRQVLTAVAAVVLLSCAAIAASKRVSYDIRNTVEGLFIPFAVAWVVFHSTVARGAFIDFLELKSVRYIGAVSYSLYLWQELSTGREAVLPAWLLLPVAALSYHFVEQPAVRFGRAPKGGALAT